MAAVVWIAFILLILSLLALDLGVFHRREHAISIREALAWCAFWVALSLAFNVLVYFLYEHHWLGFAAFYTHDLSGTEAALQFFSGYLLEESLSIDNIFVIAMIISYFAVPSASQHRVLYWGILGALVMRGAMIAAGTALISRFEWIIYVFGVLLLLTAVKLLVTRTDSVEPDRNPVVLLARRFVPMTSSFEGNRFLVRRHGALMMTPLLVAVIVIETSDVMFAIDSIPAVFAVTRDPFIVYTSNVFAILGLRSLYFALAGMIVRFRHLKTSLFFLLAFIGCKMLLSHVAPIPTQVSLIVIAGILAVGVVASLISARGEAAQPSPPVIDDIQRLAQLSLRHARQVVTVVVGVTVLAVGVAMIVLPGPAFLVIPAGLAILGVEFVWARRWLCRIRKTVGRARRSVGLGGEADADLECDGDRSGGGDGSP